MFFDGPHGGWSSALGLSSILFWVLVAVAITGVVQLFTRRLAFAGGPATPEQILAERFARGEINPDEFYERLALPTETPRPGPTMPG